jgi:hypothetical protein
MYCPKCATENQEDLAYCRSCGEDLKIISQAMKKHLSLTLMSKLDAAIEKKDERLRRESISAALMGTVFLFLAIFSPMGGNLYGFLNIFIFALGIFSVFNSGFNFLAYRRSLEIKTKRSNLLFDSESLTPDISENGNLPDNREAETNKLLTDIHSPASLIYCPRCGNQNSKNISYCRDCGTTLIFTAPPQGIERYFPAFLVNKLDAAIAKNEERDYKPRYKSGGALILVAIIFLVNVILQGILQGNWGMATLCLVIGFTVIVAGSWDLIAYQRHLEKENKVLDEPETSSSADFLTFLSNNRKIVMAIFGLILISFGLSYFGVAAEMILKLVFPLIFMVGIVFVGSYLKFKRNPRSREDKEHLADASEFPTSELPSPDTLSLAPPPLNVTEDTTRPLEAVVKKLKKKS